MKTGIKEVHFPASVKEAAGLLARRSPRAALVAGGCRLPRAMPAGVEAVVDISDLPLKDIRADRSWLRIGALCTFSDLEASPILAKWAGGLLAKAASFGTSNLARNMITVGGNLVKAYPYNHLPPALLCLGAEAAVTDGRRERLVPTQELMGPDFIRDLGSRLLLTGVRVPARLRSWSGAAAVFSKAASHFEAVANCFVAADVKSGVCREARVVLGAIRPRPVLFEEAGRLLAGRPCGEEAARAAAEAVAAELGRLMGAGAGHGREVAAVLARRTILEAFNHA